jgi:DNA-binding transcriptional regulator PaaX
MFKIRRGAEYIYRRYKRMWKRRQQRIMMQQICSEDKNALQDMLHCFNILSFGNSLEMVGG